MAAQPRPWRLAGGFVTGDGDSEFVFVPLGGAGEIGMNLNLYGFEGQWLMVDLGITFADETLPGIDIVVPDPVFIEDQRDRLAGLVLTHAHEDHLGAVAHLWERLECPVYATPFAAAMLRGKLSEAGLLDRVPLHVVAYGETITLGPFEVSYIGVTHSIPEGSSLTIKTAAGTVLHTGDWKIDPEPLVGQKTDEAALRGAGDDGVLALVCDSTNVFNPGTSGSEAAVRESLMELAADRPGRIVVTTFASNVARIATIAAVAAATGRALAVIGRSLHRTIAAAQSCGYLAELPPILDGDEAGYLPRDKVLLICTGTQGEPRAALSRIAEGEHAQVSLDPGDVVIFSSKIIPGNERPIGRICNLFARDGIEVITERDHFVHVSGHPAREELAQYYTWARPQIAIPVHGEARHLAEHARFAREQGVPQALVVENGDVVRLAPGPAAIVDHVPTGRLAVDGPLLISVEDDSIRERRRLMHHGQVTAAVVLDTSNKVVGRVAVNAHGLAGRASDTIGAELEREIAAALDDLTRQGRSGDSMIEHAVRRAVNRIVRATSGKRPLIDVNIVRLADASARPVVAQGTAS